MIPDPRPPEAGESGGWREWFPWPIGTHWCRFETVQVSIFGTYLVFVIVVALLAALGVL